MWSKCVTNRGVLCLVQALLDAFPDVRESSFLENYRASRLSKPSPRVAPSHVVARQQTECHVHKLKPTNPSTAHPEPKRVDGDREVSRVGVGRFRWSECVPALASLSSPRCPSLNVIEERRIWSSHGHHTSAHIAYPVSARRQEEANAVRDEAALGGSYILTVQDHRPLPPPPPLSSAFAHVCVR